MSGVHLHLHQLAVGYNGRALIHGIEIGVQRGEIVTLIGPNGAGKSTILKSITRQLEPIDGKVLLEMKNLLQFTPGELALCMAVVLTGRIQTELMTCRDVTAMGRYPYTGRLGILSPHDEKKVDEALAAVHAEHLAERPFDAVSDGERQRILLARAICQEPEIIVLDEPTSFLDIRHKLELLSILHKMAKQEQITVVMSLHETDLAMKISDRIICVKGDRIFACGAPGEVLNDEAIRQLYDLDPALGRFDTQTGSLELNFVKNRKPGEDKDNEKDNEKDKDKVVKGWEDKEKEDKNKEGKDSKGKDKEDKNKEEKGISAPRVLIAAPGSGSGKTLVTCGILRLLQKKGFSPVAFKCGPDYIDPMFHRQVLGIPSRNLDAFFSPDGQTLEILQKAVRKNKADIAIIEGVMGYFDGTGKTGMEASSFDLAMQTQTPVILLVNAKGMGRSIVSLIKGFCDYEIRAAEKLPILAADKRAEKQAEKLIGELIEEPIEEPIEESIEESSIDESVDKSVDKTPNKTPNKTTDKTTVKTAHTSPGKIRGVILNCISPGMAPVMKKWIEEETGLSVVGYLPQDTYFSWGSRHLGLMQPEEIADFQEQIDRLADKLETTLDTELLLKIGREVSESGCPVQEESSEQNPETKKSLSVSLVQEELAEQNLEPEKNLRSSPVRIAVARDEAFNFYYEDNLELLQECGSDLVFFSPIHDSELPEADGLILGGGYPELYAQSLAENTRMKEQIRTRVAEGMPVLAECGGFMYLQEYLEVPSDEKQALEKQASEKQAPEKQAPEKQAPEKQDLEKQDSGERDSAEKSVKPLSTREPQKTQEPQRKQETQSIQKPHKTQEPQSIQEPHKTQEPQRTQQYTMCGILEGTCKKTDHLVRFGYIEISPKSESGAGTVIRGHEFHYFDSTNNGAYCTAVKPGGKRTWDCMIVQGNVVAGFPHLYYRSNPGFINRFLDRCRMYSGWKIRKTDGEDKEKDNEKSNAIAVSKQG